MRVSRKRKWDVTHSLTPKPDFSLDVNFKLSIPEIPDAKKEVGYQKNSFNSQNARSRKHRIVEERNTQIQRTNRMLYQKIRKIMQKGHSSQKTLCGQGDQGTNSEFLSTSKPLSLPQVPSLRTTQSQLTTILDNRPKFAQKYFQDLAQAHSKLVNVHTQQIANFLSFGWKVKVLKLNHGEFIALSGRKGKRQIKKKYHYEKVKNKIQTAGLQAFISAKFQFEL